MKFKAFIIENDQLSLYGGGYGNGYVLLPKEHDLWGSYYDSEEIQNLDVHGGITFSEKVTEGLLINKRFGPYLDEKDLDKWIIGFDTKHFEDTIEIWSKEMVEKEIIKLIGQLN